MMLGPSFSVVAALKVAPSSASGVPVLSRICTPTLVALPAAEFCRARTVVLLLSMAVPAKATDALVATVVSQSSSWMLETDGRTGAPRRGQFRGTHLA